MRPSERRAARPPVSGPASVCLMLVLLACTDGARAATEPCDRTFGGTGRVMVDLGGDEAASAVAVDAGGRILVALTTRTGEREDAVLTAIAPDGRFDASPRAQSTTRIDLPPAAHVDALAPGADGSLLLGGATREGAEYALIVRLLPDGRRDPSFAAELPVRLAEAEGGASVLALGLDARRRVVVAGRAGVDAFVARLAANGVLDRTFARDGMATLPSGPHARVVAAAVDADGGAVFVAAATRTETAPLVLRTRADGALDERFGRDGVVRLALDGGVLVPRSVALDATSGRVVIGGTLVSSDGERALLLRLAADGTRDETFGVNGVLDTTSAMHADVGSAVAVQPDGRIVAAGSDGTGAARDVVVVRFARGDAHCGDGRIAAGEQCDDGAANGMTGSCCSATCTLRAAGTACRAADGACDEAELCDGRSARCPEDAFTRAGAACRAAAGACDVAEVCSGTSRECPVNDVRPRGTVCRVAGGACDLDEECDGIAGECPADAKRTGECRASRGGCDPAEWCDGASGDCPPDVLLPDGAACDDGDACTKDEICIENVCRGGARDDDACTGWLCSRMRSKRLVTGRAPGTAELRALGLEVQVDGARALCRPAVTADATTADPAAARGDEADVRAADADDDRGAFVAYKVTPLPRRHAHETAPRLESATLEDRFGMLEIAPRQVRLVSLPATVGAAEAGATRSGVAYQCQQIGAADAVATQAREVALRVVGETPSESFRVGRPLRVCHPLDAAADATDEADVRVCYELQRLGVETATTQGPLLATDAFATLLVGALGEPQLCVPAVLVRAEWSDPPPRRRRQRDPDARRPHRRRNPDHEPRPHPGRRAPRAVDDETVAP